MGLTLPSRILVSSGLTLAAWISTSTSSSRSCGSGTWTALTLSLLPYLSMVNAFMTVPGPVVLFASVGVEEVQYPCHEGVVVLERSAVSGVGVELELAVRQPPSQVDGVAAGHHPVRVAVDHQYRRDDA